MKKFCVKCLSEGQKSSLSTAVYLHYGPFKIRAVRGHPALHLANLVSFVNGARLDQSFNTRLLEQDVPRFAKFLLPRIPTQGKSKKFRPEK